MSTTLLTEKYSEQISGTISCFDRIIIQGTLPRICFAEGMTSYLKSHKIRIFDYPKYAQSLRDKLRENAKAIAKTNNVEIEYVRKKNFRKEDRISEILKERGEHPGLIHIFSAMESCPSYSPWHDKETHKTFLRFKSGKCLHYYFYFIHEKLGLCYVRVPTWLPCRLQIYFNGHNFLAGRLKEEGIDSTLIDNVFTNISDFQKAQAIADSQTDNVSALHKIFDHFADMFCPVIKEFQTTYHWSFMQAEYATDMVFKRQSDLANIYEAIVRTAIHTVKPGNVATFLGRKLHGNYKDEVGNDFNTRIQGTRIKHQMGPVSIKMYDKLSIVLRIETTVNDVSFFKHYRKVEQRDGKAVRKNAAMKKGIYSFPPLARLLKQANGRYLEFISTIDDRTTGIKNVKRLSKSVRKKNRSFKGINFFDDDDLQILYAAMSGEFNITGFQNKQIREKLSGKSSSQVTRILARLRHHGMIKKIAKTHKYYLTKLGRHAITTALKIKELVIIPELCYVR